MTDIATEIYKDAYLLPLDETLKNLEASGLRIALEETLSPALAGSLTMMEFALTAGSLKVMYILDRMREENG